MSTRDEERESIIVETASMIDKSRRWFRDEAELQRGPGKYEGISDVELAKAIETLHLHGSADHSGGDMNVQGHGIQVDRWVLFTDSNGFLSLEEYDSIEEATDVIDALPTEYDEED